MENIKQYWEHQAEIHGESHWASWGDNYAIELEIANIKTFLAKDDVVLDVGCGNGFSTIAHLESGIQSITGIDFSEKLIAQANQRSIPPEYKGEIHFKWGDVRQLDFPDNSFDIVYTTRVLINLLTWEEQLQGIKECLRVCKNGGTVILSEAFWEPLTILNAMRTLVRLPPLVEHDFNRYLKKRVLESFLDSMEITFEVIDFSSIYYLGSRLVRELVTNVDDYPGYSNPINRIFFDIEKVYSGGGFGIQQAYVLKP